MNYRIYYKESQSSLEYKYATTVKKILLDKVILECFMEDYCLLIIQHNCIQNMDSIYYIGSSNQYKLQMKQKIHKMIKTKQKGPQLKKVS